MPRTFRQWVHVKGSRSDALDLDQFELREARIPEVRHGEALVRVNLINIHANTRMRMATGAIPSGETDPTNYACAEVVASRDSAFKEGDLIACQAGWQEYQLVSSALPALGHGQASELTKALNRTNSPWLYAFRPVMTRSWPPEVLMEIFGTSGMTAYFGLRECGPLMPRDRVLVAAASGSVGSISAQLAKAAGSYVVGLAGGVERAREVKEQLGIDDCIDYRAADLRSELQKAFPSGIDVFTDGVGGDLTERIIGQMNRDGRLLSYGGAAAFYGDRSSEKTGLARHELFGLTKNVEKLLRRKNIKSEYWMVDAFYHERISAEDTLSRLLLMKKLRPLATVVDGFENVPQAIVELYRKGRSGKLQVRFSS